MPSKISLFNRGFLHNDFRKYSWVAACYAIGLFLTVPLQVIMALSNEHASYVFMEDIFLMSKQVLQSMLLVIVPIVLAMLLFRYLHVKGAADMLHSLPVHRSSLYRTHVLAGIILLIIPVLLNGIIALVLNQWLDLDAYYTVLDVCRWSGYALLFSVTFFLSCVLMGMLTGITLAQGALTFLLLIFPPCIIMLFMETLSYLIYGFNYNLNISMEILSPLFRLSSGFAYVGQKMSSLEITVYLVFCLSAFLLSAYLYKLRNIEYAGQAIVFPQMRNLFKYGVAFCAMLTGGLYFYSVQHTMAWTVCGYLIGSLLGYVIAEMVLNKSLSFFRDRRSYKGYLLFCVVVMLCFLVVKADFFGYERRQPSLDEVQRVFCGDFFFYDDTVENSEGFFSEKENISNIYRLHQEVIQTKSKNYFKKESPYQTRWLTFVYQLKNGDHISRRYTINDKDYASYLKLIYESQEYKYMEYAILNIDPADVEKISLQPNVRPETGKGVAVVASEEIKEMLAAMRQDVLDRTYEDMRSDRTPWASISLSMAEGKSNNYTNVPATREIAAEAIVDANIDANVYIDWEKSDLNLEKWLQEKGYYQQARILPEDLSCVVIKEILSRRDWEELSTTAQDILFMDKSNGQVIIRDKDLIEACLRAYGEGWRLSEESGYSVIFYGKDNVIYDMGSFIGADTPDFIKGYFAP